MRIRGGEWLIRDWPSDAESLHCDQAFSGGTRGRSKFFAAVSRSQTSDIDEAKPAMDEDPERKMKSRSNESLI